MREEIKFYDATDASTSAVTLTVLNQHNRFQLTFEVVLTATGVAHVPGAGTITVSYKPKGATASEDLTSTIDCTACPLTYTLEGSYESLTFTPASLDGDCSFIVKAASWKE